MNRKFRIYLQHLFEIEIFCNIMHGFTVSFDQFNVPFLRTEIITFTIILC